MSRSIVARAPTRIDLGGGWTDVPPYCDREGGFVCNVAITRYAVVHVSASPDQRSIAHPEDVLLRAAIERSGSTGVRVELVSDFPVGAGLGGSSAASAAALGGLAAWRESGWDRAEIAEEGRAIEVDRLGIAGGRQDHYAATHGGALALTFTESVHVRRIPLTAETRHAIASRSLLVYTGESRVSGDTITAVLDAYRASDPAVTRALGRMRELAEQMAASLEGGDLDAVGEMLGEHWEHQRSLHPSIPTARIDDIIASARRSGALGAKAMGASGGGCVLVLTRTNDTERVRSAVAPLGEILSFGMDESGLTVNAEDP